MRNIYHFVTNIYYFVTDCSCIVYFVEVIFLAFS